MNSTKNIVVAIALSALSPGYLGTAQAAETVKPSQGVHFPHGNQDAVAYYPADNGTCKVVLMVTDKTFYAPARFEDAVEASKPTLHPIDDGKALEFACQASAQAMTINMVATVAAQH